MSVAEAVYRIRFGRSEDDPDLFEGLRPDLLEQIRVKCSMLAFKSTKFLRPALSLVSILVEFGVQDISTVRFGF